MDIQKIVDRQYCLGCGLCASIVGDAKIQMKSRPDGFLAPELLNGFDGEVDALDQYCPGISVKMDRKLRNASEKIYGPFLELKVAHATDPEIRYRGSSGGLLTAVVCGLLEQGKIDGVLQAGPCSDSPIKTRAYFSTTADEVIANAGSRYAPSSLLTQLKQILDTHSRIAVVGKPCDIVAVKQFVKAHPEYEDKVYCTLSFMCMGLPSHNATLKLIERLGIEDLDSISELIYRGRGWPGEAFATTRSGDVHSCSYDESWSDILGRDILFRCKVCPDGWGSFADISSGDPWYTDGKGPLFEPKPGRSFLFSRTERGQEILDACATYVTCADYDISELPIIQKSQHARKKRVWLWYIVLKLLGDRLLQFRGLGMWNQMFKSSPLMLARELRGIIRRLPR